MQDVVQDVALDFGRSWVADLGTQYNLAYVTEQGLFRFFTLYIMVTLLLLLTVQKKKSLQTEMLYDEIMLNYDDIGYPLLSVKIKNLGPYSSS